MYATTSATWRTADPRRRRATWCTATTSSCTPSMSRPWTSAAPRRPWSGSTWPSTPSPGPSSRRHTSTDVQPATAVLVHSPFLGPASLRPLADALAGFGHPAVLLDLRPSVVAAPVHQVLVGAFADAIGDASLSGPLVLIGHSGAGPLQPAFADVLDEDVVGLVFLDAGLPTPGRSWRSTVPVDLYNQLRDVSRDGQLPRWHHWFTPDPLASLDPDLRAEIADEAPEVPLAF